MYIDACMRGSVYTGCIITLDIEIIKADIVIVIQVYCFFNSRNLHIRRASRAVNTYFLCRRIIAPVILLGTGFYIILYKVAPTGGYAPCIKSDRITCNR